VADFLLRQKCFRGEGRGGKAGWCGQSSRIEWLYQNDAVERSPCITCPLGSRSTHPLRFQIWWVTRAGWTRGGCRGYLVGCYPPDELEWHYFWYILPSNDKFQCSTGKGKAKNRTKERKVWTGIDIASNKSSYHIGQGIPISSVTFLPQISFLQFYESWKKFKKRQQGKGSLVEYDPGKRRIERRNSLTQSFIPTLYGLFIALPEN